MLFQAAIGPALQFDSYMPWQKIHADYSGPFLNKYYTLILIDSYSKWPEVFLTKKLDRTFGKLTMRRTFSREGVVTVGTNIGTNFTSNARLVAIDWLPAHIYPSLTSQVQRLRG